MEVLRAENIFKSYSNTNVLKAVNITISEGEFVGIMGKSGSGKTTLLKILGMIEVMTKGKLFYKNEEIQYFKDKELARIRREELGFVFQEFFLMDSLNVLENILLPLYIKKKVNSEGKENAKYLMGKFNIEELGEKMPDELSGGEKQRVAICRALLNNPNLLFADEPTGNLDSKSGKIVINALESINKNMGKTVVMVTHDPQMASYCNRIILLKDGSILGQIEKNRDQKQFYKKIIDAMVEL